MIKIPQKKILRAREKVPYVNHLLLEYEVLSSNPSTHVSSKWVEQSLCNPSDLETWDFLGKILSWTSLVRRLSAQVTGAFSSMSEKNNLVLRTSVVPYPAFVTVSLALLVWEQT